ncbi:D-alanyl-D-alanine carboxypeptidase family protein [Polycladomyces subterraneus]|uniref:serine-type D-Ala-D-Ala carboxypeptidase n=1 Tax=Polycladomyces subterraneus TaxID=1016997 RepID=A0ABT8IIC6_9BACL|nr:D-alanyl-D-alanine carboxypeptidase family protein [Polycladomyces subterraneus]MDN4592535.1 D-alanyl-D-alanine carboxypeptidase [Polycladomyces subterraneus]
MRRWFRSAPQRKIAALLLIFCLLPSLVPAQAASKPPQVRAASYIVMEFQSGRVLAEKEADVPRPPASMTKMMVEYIVMEKVRRGELHWEDQVTVSKHAAGVNEAQVNLVPGEKRTVLELFTAMAVYSANDATVALAEKIGGSEEAFVGLMNRKARELGMSHTHFHNATGLDNYFYADPPNVPGSHVMSARDCALLARRLLKDHPEVTKIISQPRIVFRKGEPRQQRLTNWNLMLPGLRFYYPGVDGLKTGHTRNAGYCFTGTAVKNGMRLITVVMDTPAESTRFTVTKQLLDYGFSQFTLKTFLSGGQVIPGYERVPVTDGVVPKIPLVTDRPVAIPIEKGQENRYTLHVDYIKKLEAPLRAGEVVGTLRILYDGKEIKNLDPIPVRVLQDVEKASWWDLFFRKIGEEVSGWFS